MIRVLLFLLISASVTARASDPISAPVQGASATVTQPHVTAELIPETTTVQPGQPFDVALHLHADPDWHTYWINPGDAGLATTISWTLPPGFSAGPIQWPTPEKHAMGPLMTYGYAGDVYLLVTITPPKADLPRHFDLKADAQWLVCKEECIPGHADLTLPLDSGLLNLRLPAENKDFFGQARERLPVENTLWEVSGDYTVTGEMSGALESGRPVFEMGFESNAGKSPTNLGHVYFFPEQNNVFDSKNPELHDGTPNSQGFLLVIDLIQNGEKPSNLSGVLVADNALIGSSKAVHIPSINIFNGSPTPKSTQPVAVDRRATVPSSDAASVARRSTATTQPFFLGVLGAAFLGGLILNLMPCVLPVLSLKVFSLVRHAGNDPRGAWKQGAAFTSGVVISFWVLAGLLLALRAFGNDLGWGFQMQSPGFILGMIFLFFLLALNLFGVFEMGTSLVGLDAKATGRFHGLTSSFLNGALATLAATPCTGPLMGSTLGFASQQSASVAMLIFTFLALGMASPYLLLTIFPGALRFVPKPGAWMEAFKQFMGFLLMVAVVWFVSVFGASVGEDRISWLLLALLLTGIAAWIYGRWISFDKPLKERLLPFLFMLVFLGAGLKLGIFLALEPVAKAVENSAEDSDGYQPWTPAAVDAALAQGHPVFVDFTAAWCLSCKVNERVSLDTEAVQQAFKDKKVALFRADWTHADPDISKTLRQYNRDGVPLYLLYSPKDKNAPQVLPEVLTPGIVLDALKKL